MLVSARIGGFARVGAWAQRVRKNIRAGGCTSNLAEKQYNPLRDKSQRTEAVLFLTGFVVFFEGAAQPLRPIAPSESSMTPTFEVSTGYLCTSSVPTNEDSFLDGQPHNDMYSVYVRHEEKFW